MNKYRKGRLVFGLEDFLKARKNENSFYFNHKFMSYKWLERWPLITLEKAINKGVVRHARLNLNAFM